jgi:hypothetical protein
MTTTIPNGGGLIVIGHGLGEGDTQFLSLCPRDRIAVPLLRFQSGADMAPLQPIK